MAQIRIKASMLEAERKDPLAYGRLIAFGEENTGGGSYGNVCLHGEVARAVHLKKKTLRQAIRELHTKFLRFRSTEEN